MSETFVGLRGQLMVLDAGAEDTLSRALAQDRGGSPVVAGMTPPGSSAAGQGALGRWRTITGAVGRTLTLDPLGDIDLERAAGVAGATRDTWHPARFSRLR